MATFDIDAYRATRESFEIVLGGKRFIARPVSAEVVISTQQELKSDNGATVNAALRRLLRAAFPWTLAMWWRGDPVEMILSLDLATRREYLTRFFLFLGGLSAVPPATNGTP